MKRIAQRESDRAEIIPKWPDRINPDRGCSVPSELIGATIIGIGTSREKIEGGGLVIDYTPVGETTSRRIKLAFNELGMWVHPLSPTEDEDQECAT